MELIHDLNLLQDYIDKYLNDNNKYYYRLSFRRKYLNEDIRYNFKDSIDLKKGLVAKRYLVDDIVKIERYLDLFNISDDTKLIDGSYVLALNINPRNVLEARKQLQKSLIDSNDSVLNLHYSSLQKCGIKDYLVFDIDSNQNSEEIISNINDFFEHQVGDLDYHIIKTRGGYHFYIKRSSIPKRPKNNKWYMEMRDIPHLDKNVDTDTSSPLVGTYQGGFKTHLIYSNW